MSEGGFAGSEGCERGAEEEGLDNALDAGGGRPWFGPVGEAVVVLGTFGPVGVEPAVALGPLDGAVVVASISAGILFSALGGSKPPRGKIGQPDQVGLRVVTWVGITMVGEYRYNGQKSNMVLRGSF
jgi:hypothetical protein